MSLLVVGSIGFDDIETPFASVKRVLGGSATYIALTARYFVNSVALIGAVGRDFSKEHVEMFRTRNIDLQGLEINQNGKTFAWGGRYRYDLNQRETLFTHLNVLETFSPIVPEAHRDAHIVCLGNIDPVLQHHVLDQVHAPHMVICDTMNFWIEHARESLLALLPRVDCLIINDSEARQMADESNLLKAARKIRAMGPSILVIKKGEHGAMLFQNETVFVAPAYPIEDIHDPTGAGDVFLGGMGGILARQGRFDIEVLRRAVVYGSAMASFVVEQIGPGRLLDLTEETIAKRAEAFRELSAIPSLSQI